MTTKTQAGFNVSLTSDFEDAIAKVTEALKVEGFGVLTEIDVKTTLKKKLDVEFRPYKILGACNPSLAHRALSAAPQVGMLLPCNVTVSQEENGTLVSIVDPLAMLNIIDNSELQAVAEEAEAKLRRVAQALEG
jgi:uncharacterized protein (DUF302 family)